jgi:hypothetical protein
MIPPCPKVQLRYAKTRFSDSVRLMNTDLIEWLTQHKEIVKDFVVPLASALIGAIAGAAAGYWPARQLAKRSSDEILKRDAGARHEGELRAARQVYVKLHTVANSIGTYHK